MDLKAFRKTYGTRPLSFATAEELHSILNVSPGAVTPFGLLNDATRKVTFCIDQAFDGGLIGCHPNENTATVWLSTKDLIALIKDHGTPVWEVVL